LQEVLRDGRLFAKAAAWFFAALSLTALLSPLGATHDEQYHARNIWCGRGERAIVCPERLFDSSGTRIALTPIESQNCQVPANLPLNCPTDRGGQSYFRTNDDLYPGFFYFALSWLVFPQVSVDVTTVLVRLGSVAIISMLFGLALWLLPARHRLVLILLSLTSFTATGFFLFGSINPSSWTSFGLGVGWLACHAALTSDVVNRWRRVSLCGVATFASLMVVGSRWDGIPFLVLATYLISLHVAWTRFPLHHIRVVAIGLAAPVALVGLLTRFAPPRLGLDVSSLFSFSSGQRDNVVFLSDNLLQGIPNALKALGTVPTMSAFELPEIVFIAAIALLGVFISQTFNRNMKLQMYGALVVAATIGLVIAAQIAYIDDRDAGGVEPRYVYPLLLLGVGWWYLSGPDNLAARVDRYLKPASIVTTTLFALVGYATAERFVDRKTSGLRYLPEGPDQWWWTWAPFGPNLVVVFAPLCLWFFYRTVLRALGDTVSN
jgi:hypothetical protein